MPASRPDLSEGGGADERLRADSGFRESGQDGPVPSHERAAGVRT